MTERERLLGALRGQALGRAPVVCPGGMMTPLCAEVIEAAGLRYPLCHRDGAEMARAALAIRDLAGFENLGVPFCMSVEAEALGLPVDYGSPTTCPHAHEPPAPSPPAVPELRLTAPASHRRVAAVLDAIGRLKAACPGVPIVGNVVGPVTLACMLVEPLALMRLLKRGPRAVEGLLDTLAAWLAEFAALQARCGADVVAVAEPTGTGEVLGPRWFAQLCLPHVNRVLAAARAAGAGTIVHICGQTRSIAAPLGKLDTPCVSVDCMADISGLPTRLGGKAVMGNVSPFTIESGPEAAIAQAAAAALRAGAAILAPACGITPATPLRHLRALTDAGKCLL
ncbi:MAG: methylcobamide--CoM methyltransferase [Planctomycetes bacterium]|nr:methylcobamide--CoM methyltransferase [Planctomycetota bacterium]